MNSSAAYPTRRSADITALPCVVPASLRSVEPAAVERYLDTAASQQEIAMGSLSERDERNRCRGWVPPSGQQNAMLC